LGAGRAGEVLIIGAAANRIVAKKYTEVKKGMVKKLGKVQKPSVKEFEKGRKLFFLPLVFTPAKPAPDFKELLDKYWQQARGQIGNLEEKLAPITNLYHEWVSDSGEEGLKAIEAMEAGNKEIVKSIIEAGAEIRPIEDSALLDEFMDWGRCLSVGLVSQKVFSEVYRSYIDIQKKRQEYIARRIDETLKGDEVGLLVMKEGHQVQFPSDIQVFYIAPPALDEIRRWLRDKEHQPKKQT
jgi:hypothetical protein